MERKFYTDDFEQLLKEKSDEFRMYPSKRVWHSIYNDLHPGRKWPSIAVSMVLILALLMVGYWNNNTNSKTTIAAVNSGANIVTPLNTASKNGNAAINSSALQTDNAVASGTPGISLERTNRSNQTATGNSPKNLTAPGVALAYTTNLATHKRVAIASRQPNAKNSNTIKADPAETNTSFNNQQQSENSTTGTKLNQGDDVLSKNSHAYSAEQNGIKATVSAATSTQDIVSTVTEDANLPVNIRKNAAGITDNKMSESANKDFVAASPEVKVIMPAVVGDKKLMTATNDDKAWIEDYAFHNKSKRKNWQDRTAFEIYLTPSIGYRTLTNDAKYNTALPASPLNNAAVYSIDANKSVSQTPALGLEAGFSIAYSVAKNLRLKAGLQANYINYSINAEETNHPVVTTLLLTDQITGANYIQPVTSTLANTTGAQTIKVHSKSYQVSLPIGAALKLGGNNKLEWYAGATIQPTAIIGSKSYLISADRKNYVEDASLLRKWNLNAGFETYINYKFDGFTLRAGPQFRYQLLSTYKNTYTVKENLYNVGLKVGILKNF